MARLLSGKTAGGVDDVTPAAGDMEASSDVRQASSDGMQACERLQPGALDIVRRLCGSSASDDGVSRDTQTAVDGESRDGSAGLVGESRDSGARLDKVSRDAVISSILAQSTEEFFGGHVGGGGGGAARLRRRPEVGLSLSEFLAAAAAVETATDEGKAEKGDGAGLATVATSIPDEERIEALVRRVTARVEEVFRCATMDRKTEIPTDCY